MKVIEGMKFWLGYHSNSQLRFSRAKSLQQMAIQVSNLEKGIITLHCWRVEA